jgi:large subunit ribosomal protein L4
MATVEIKDVQGKVLEERELPETFFGAPVNVAVMHQVVQAGLAAKRAGTHSTKTRGEVAGGGKKPWRQKGTGRARQGSIRAPQWMGGGIAHGPKPRSYEMRINRKMKKASLRSALSDAAASGKLSVLSGLAFEGPRTKDAVGVLEALELEGAVLLVIAAPDEGVEKSFRNLPQVKIDYPGNLSTYDVLYADRIVLTTEAISTLTGEEFKPPAAAPKPASKSRTRTKAKASAEPTGEDGAETVEEVDAATESADDAGGPAEGETEVEQ